MRALEEGFPPRRRGGGTFADSAVEGALLAQQGPLQEREIVAYRGLLSDLPAIGGTKVFVSRFAP